jgi:hypothetical protein
VDVEAGAAGAGAVDLAIIAGAIHLVQTWRCFGDDDALGFQFLGEAHTSTPISFAARAISPMVAPSIHMPRSL